MITEEKKNKVLQLPECLLNLFEINSACTVKLLEEEHGSMFRVGDYVKWSSQAAGSVKTKYGIIVAVVPENTVAFDKSKSTCIDQRLLLSYSISNLGSGSPRVHQSYLVAVHYAGGERNGLKGWLYYPLAKNLVRDDTVDIKRK